MDLGWDDGLAECTSPLSGPRVLVLAGIMDAQ